MRVMKDYGSVRIVNAGSPYEGDDIRVEWQKNDEWELYRGFNSLSDDYAYQNSQNCAIRAVELLNEQEV